MLSTIIRLFPLWAVAVSVIAFFMPDMFAFSKSLIEPLLILIMLSMGLTLGIDDFVRIKQRPLPVVVGVVLQFVIMPVTALLVSSLLHLDQSLALGMILVGSVAGGTASNVICYLAKADVALSITMTAVSTLLGVLLTPLLVELLAGTRIDIPVTAMLMSLIKIVFLPVGVGVILNHFISRQIKDVAPILPLLAMLSIVWVIGIVIAMNSDSIFETGLLLITAIIIHNSIGMFLGFKCCRLLGFDTKVCRTVAIEVGMQNSGLAIALAIKFFASAAAVPGALFSIWHNVSGSFLAGIWSNVDKECRT